MEKIADRDELLELLTEHARQGSVSACRCLLDELRRDVLGHPLPSLGWEEIYGDGLDELDAHANITSLRRRPS
jgi:hypothetical protein